MLLNGACLNIQYVIHHIRQPNIKFISSTAKIISSQIYCKIFDSHFLKIILTICEINI